MIDIMPKRCVFGCPYTKPYHQFPNPEKNPDGFKAWIRIVGGKLDSQDDYEYYRKKVVCDVHFTDKDRNCNNRLNFLAVPSLHLHGNCSDFGPSHSNVVISMPIVAGLAGESKKCDTSVTPVKILIPSMVTNEQNSLSISRTIMKENGTGIIALEHNYSRLSKNVIKKRKKQYQQSTVPSLTLEKLKTSRRKIKILQAELIRLKKKNKAFENRLADAELMSKNDLINRITNKMTTAAKIFTEMQYTQTSKNPCGRRFTLEEKVLSLSLYKKSPRSYPFLAKYFTIPSSQSLKRLLSKIEVDSGLNQSIFTKIKDTVKDLKPEDRLCTGMIFDEMSITPQIHYNAAKDMLNGFTFDDKNIADHVLVFMVRGIRRKFKQPISYHFTNCLKKDQLKNILQKVIRYVQQAGLKILCTVCDQSTVNVSVINELINDTRQKYLKEGKVWKNDIIEISGSKIIPLFDVPHLLKGIRNNLLIKDMKYFDFDEKCEKKIKWEYFKMVYEADKSYGELRLLQKLTDEHIYIDKIRKMKVKTAAQIFSHSMAAVTGHLVQRGDVPQDCLQLMKFTKLIDSLFDSLNSNSFSVLDSKIYRVCIRRGSPHHDLWNNAIKILKTVSFIKTVKDKNNQIRVIETKAIPSIRNLIRTIEGMQHLWKKLSQSFLFDAMLTRQFNQDPLENFFGNIRSYGGRNHAPDSVAFQGAFKSLLISNFNSSHSLHANCENDDSIFLQNVDFFIKSNSPSTSDITSRQEIVAGSQQEIPQQSPEKVEEIILPFINLNDNISDAGQGNYVCGWALAKCFKKISKSCTVCKNDMCGEPGNDSNKYIRAKEYNINKKSLLYPSKDIEKCFVQIQNLVSDMLKRDIPKKNLKHKIKIFTDIFVDFPFNCETHKNELRVFFENIVINILIYSWCRSINRILSGKIIYHGNDDIKLAAQYYRNKHKCNK